MRSIPLGSKESLLVDVTDRAGSVSTLVGTTPQYTVVESSTGTKKYDNVAATVVGMRVASYIDTTGWAPGNYRLYIDFLTGPDNPMIGPFLFRVVA